MVFPALPRLAILALMASCSTPVGEIVVCEGNSDCPAGSLCEGGRCRPEELAPIDASIERPDVGVDVATDADGTPSPEDAAPDAEQPDADAGAGDVGADATEDAPTVGALLVRLEAPEAGAALSGDVQVEVIAATDSELELTELGFVVDGVERGTREGSLRAASFTWDTRAIADGEHRLAGLARDSGGREQLTNAISVTVSNRGGLVSVEGDRFTVDGQVWGLVGIEYEPAPDADAEALALDLRAVATAGFTAIEVAAPGIELEPAENVFDQSACDRLGEILDGAAAAGLRVLVRLPPIESYAWLAGAYPAYRTSLQIFVDGRLRSVLARRQANVVERCELAARQEILGFDILRAARAGDQSGRSSPLAVAAWEAWTLEKYGDRSSRQEAWGGDLLLTCGPEDDTLCPPPGNQLCAPPGIDAISLAVLDHRAFVRDAADAAIADLVRKLGLADRDHLFTVGHQSGIDGPVNGYETRCRDGESFLDPRVGASHVDFVLVRAMPWQGAGVSPSTEPLPPGQTGYADDFLKAEYLSAYARVGKPVVLGGFHYETRGDGQREGIQAEVWARALDGVAYAGLAGSIGERWRDDVRALGDGLVDGAGVAKPAVAEASSRAPALAAPEPWTPDVRILARRGAYPRFVDVVSRGMAEYRLPRVSGERVGVLTCDQIVGEAECGEVVGCAEHCAP